LEKLGKERSGIDKRKRREISGPWRERYRKGERKEMDKRFCGWRFLFFFFPCARACLIICQQKE